MTLVAADSRVSPVPLAGKLMTLVKDFAFGDLTSGTEATLFWVPKNARLIAAGLCITTAFDSGTSDVIDMGFDDGTTDDPDGYLVDATAQTVGHYGADGRGVADKAGALQGAHKYSVADTEITITWTAVGTAAAAGAGYAYVQYAMLDNSDGVS